MERRPGIGKRPKVEEPLQAGESEGDELNQQLHDLNNTLASMRLRLGLLAADPVCRETQGENLRALLSISDKAIQMVRGLRPSLDEEGLARAPTRRVRRGDARR
jgi:hypothetical protein